MQDWKPPKVTTFAELAIRPSRGRPRTVATVKATLIEHTLKTQTRVKRESLLRIREKCGELATTNENLVGYFGTVGE